MPDITQPDISEEPRAFTVDEVLAAADLRPDPGVIESEPGIEPEPTWASVPEPSTIVIERTLANIDHAHDECVNEIDRLVEQRLLINAEIKVRRRQLNQLQRMARIVGEPDDDTLDLDD